MLTIIIDKEDYKILKDLTERTFTKSKKKTKDALEKRKALL